MLSFTQNTGVSGAPQKLVHYRPHVRLADNGRVGYSMQADGITPADGTLYAINLTAQAYSGSIQSEETTEYGNSGGYQPCDDSYIQNGTKVKKFDSHGFKLGSLVYAKVATLLAKGFDLGCPLPFASGRVVWRDFYEITSTTFMAIMFDGTNTLAVVGTIATDGGITWGTTSTIIAGAKEYNTIFVNRMSATKYMALYNNGANIEARCWTVSGTTITMGTALTVVARSASSYFLCNMNQADKVLALYYVGSVAYYCVLTAIGTTTITNIGEQTAMSTGYYYPTASFESDGSGLVITGMNSSGYLYARAGTVSGNTLTLGTETAMESSTNWMSSSHAIQPRCVGTNKHMVIYPQVQNGGVVFTRSGTSVTMTTRNALSNYGALSIGQSQTINLGASVMTMIQGATTAKWYHYSMYSTGATEDQGCRLTEIDYNSSNDTLTYTNHDLVPNYYSAQNFIGYSNYGFAFGHIGTYDLIGNIYSSTLGQLKYFLGEGTTVELYNQTYNGTSMVDGTVMTTIDTTYKSICAFRYPVNKVIGTETMNLKIKKTSAGTDIVKLIRLCLTTK